MKWGDGSPGVVKQVLGCRLGWTIQNLRRPTRKRSTEESPPPCYAASTGELRWKADETDIKPDGTGVRWAIFRIVKSFKISNCRGWCRFARIRCAGLCAEGDDGRVGR